MVVTNQNEYPAEDQCKKEDRQKSEHNGWQSFCSRFMS